MSHPPSRDERPASRPDSNLFPNRSTPDSPSRVRLSTYSTPTAQSTLDASPAWPAPFALVALDRAQSALGRELTYAIPDDLRDLALPGMAVVVPFGRQKLNGYLIALTDKMPDDVPQLKPIEQVVGTAPVFDAVALKVARWMSAYYHCSLSECLACAVPPGGQATSERKYVFCAAEPLRALRDLSRAPRQLEIAQLLLRSDKALSPREIVRALHKSRADAAKISSVADALKRLLDAEIIAAEDQLANPNVRPRRLLAVKLAQSTLDADARAKLQSHAPRQAHALQTLAELQEAPGAPEWFPVGLLGREWSVDAAALRALEKKSLIEFSAVEQSRASFTRLPASDAGRIHLNDEQQNAVDVIAQSLQSTLEGAAQTVLLQGVTASGKTEVYLHAIERCLEMGRRALVLVPEIALTAQTVEIFQRRFQEKVAILHSALGAGERFDEWRRARSGEAEIVVGARSAIFAPCENVGLIIIDEEHDGSYKQDATPRYHARDVAHKRAALENDVVVLGSATPSVESFFRATKGEYRHVKMQRRFAARPLPLVEIVDMTTQAQMGQLPVLSARLKEELIETVGRGEQAIIFLNRRGFATYVQCLSCGHVERCPNCDVSLTFHRSAQSLNCHHCDFQKPTLNECPQCAGWMIGFTGSGTEKVQSEIEALLSQRGLPDAKVLRLDRDTTTQKGAHAQILSGFRNNRAQVLIGTQMVTKGLDFPNVTLVGVISADTALNVPDFRAAERTFQLLTQVAGRAGRGERLGKVLIQTLAVDHYSITAAREHDFEKFIAQETEFRKEPPYPPFSYVVNVISQDEDERTARERIERLAAKFGAHILEHGSVTELLGPVSCPIARVKNKFRFHLLLRDRNRPRLHKVLSVYDDLPRESREGLTVDVDCTSIL